MRILSGIQPSGLFHLGNYFAMIRRMVEYQEENDLFLFVASYHAMTTVTDAKILEENIHNAVIDSIALGIDPDKATFWVQSDVPEVNELTWLLSTSLTVSQLELAHSFKDKVAQGIVPTAGLFYYPVLMAADILLFGSEKVPVGKDQKQHLEIARDIARKFNNQYGETFLIPEPDILEDTATVPGVDGRKMSKSYNNYLYVFWDEKTMKKKVMSIVTDSKGMDEAKDPDESFIYQIHSLFLNDEECQDVRERFATPGLGYGHLKQDLLKTILEYFAPMREKQMELAKRPDDIKDIMKMGAEKAREAASVYLTRARKNIGLAWY